MSLGSSDVGHTEAALAAEEIRVLVVEDDLGYAVLVEEFLVDSGEPIRVAVATNLDQASLMVPGEVACVLLDLGLPDAQGLEALDRILKSAPDVAVVVLTGRADRDLALRAVGAGAQDYLTKDEVDPANLARSIRYAVERKRAVDSAQKLLATDLLAAERDRLERGLLPRPLVHDSGLAWASRNRPAGGSLMLGGDFFDAVELEDSRVRVVIGDVCGHGPDEAALGVALRIVLAQPGPGGGGRRRGHASRGVDPQSRERRHGTLRDDVRPDDQRRPPLDVDSGRGPPSATSGFSAVVLALGGQAGGSPGCARRSGMADDESQLAAGVGPPDVHRRAGRRAQR